MLALRAISTLALAATIAAACSASGASPGASSAPVAQGSAPAAGGLSIGTVSSATLGFLLTGASGMTLYTHAGDGPNLSTCTGACATAWPPLTVATGGQATAVAGVSGQLGTFTRADGVTQVTYDGMPLYYWQGDAKPGDATGDGVNGFSVAKVSGAAPAPAASGKPGY